MSSPGMYPISDRSSIPTYQDPKLIPKQVDPEQTDTYSLNASRRQPTAQTLNTRPAFIVPNGTTTMSNRFSTGLARLGASGGNVQPAHRSLHTGTITEPRPRHHTHEMSEQQPKHKPSAVDKHSVSNDRAMQNPSSITSPELIQEAVKKALDDHVVWSLAAAKLDNERLTYEIGQIEAEVSDYYSKQEAAAHYYYEPPRKTPHANRCITSDQSQTDATGI